MPWRNCAAKCSPYLATHSKSDGRRQLEFAKWLADTDAPKWAMSPAVNQILAGRRLRRAFDLDRCDSSIRNGLICQYAQLAPERI